jgi:hypothetical protein
MFLKSLMIKGEPSMYCWILPLSVYWLINFLNF